MTLDISSIRKSRFLTKEDVDPSLILTIKDVIEESVAPENMPEELKYVVYFREVDRGLVLNWTNGQLIARLIDKTDMEQWGGEKVELYHDPGVSFGNKLVGGIRVRSALTGQKDIDEFDDDIPFN